ncbi:MAG: N-acetylmuramic acid 6-phosphate etherase [Bacteroidales bacterium]
MRYDNLLTEKCNPNSYGLDVMPTDEILELINDDHRGIYDVVAQAIPDISRAVDVIVQCLGRGGSLIFVGAGTSGRLGISEAAECLPTFGVGPDMVSAIVAGGRDAVFTPAEGAEDDERAGAMDMMARASADCVIVGITASGGTRYVKGALDKGRSIGAATIAIVCNHPEHVALDADILIALPVGPEVLAGSTRMKAGSAQKLVLNMLTTASMAKLGRIYNNLMIDLQPTNSKLKERAISILSRASGLSHAKSETVLTNCDWNTKTALVMSIAGVDRASAEDAIVRSKGHVRKAVKFAERALCE